MILVSFQSVSKRLSLLALASTVPFNCPPSESLRHRKGNRDQIVFLKLYLLYRHSGCCRTLCPVAHRPSYECRRDCHERVNDDRRVERPAPTSFENRPLEDEGAALSGS